MQRGYPQTLKWVISENFMKTLIALLASVIVGIFAVLYYREYQQWRAEEEYQSAVRYFDGKCVKQDYAETVRLLKQSSDRGHLPAVVMLAAMYRNGSGVAKNLSGATGLLEKAARSGDVGAMVTLATMYDYGQDVPADRTKALKLYEEAAKRGDKYASLTLKKLREEKSNSGG